MPRLNPPFAADASRRPPIARRTAIRAGLEPEPSFGFSAWLALFAACLAAWLLFDWLLP